MNGWLDIAMTAVILLGLAYAIFRGGAANPETTGSLGKKFNAMKAEMKAEMGRMSSRLGRVEIDMEEVKREGATTKDVERIEKVFEERLATVRAEMEGQHELAERTWKSVSRIENYLIEKGLGGK